MITNTEKECPRGEIGRHKGLKIPRIHKLLTPWYSLGHSERANAYFLFLTLQLARVIRIN